VYLVAPVRRAPKATATSIRPAWISRSRIALALAATAATAILVGCGSGAGSSSPSTGPGSSGSASTGSTSTSAATHHAKPVGPPPQKESLADAAKRIASTVASGDCAKINALDVKTPNHASQQKLQKSCAKLKKRLGKKPSKMQSFKGLAGVFDYAGKKRHSTAVLVRGADGLYHFAFISRFVDGPTVGTPFAPKYNQVAKTAFAALKTKNCDAFLKVAYVVTGPASKGRQKVCPRFSKNIVAKTVEKTPSATPKLIGGNRYFAFYGVNGKTYLTLVLARQSPSQRPPGTKPGKLVVPKGASEYAYVDAFATNEKQKKSK
jgi:hypothetical protein